jgi:hypothetical protein
MSIENNSELSLIEINNKHPNKYEMHHYMLCVYSITMYQYQIIIFDALQKSCNNRFVSSNDFFYLYIIMVFSMYWLRIFSLFITRLYIVDKTQAMLIIKKINKLLIGKTVDNNTKLQ